MSVNYKLIGSRIQAKRKSLNLTQERLAEYLDVTPGYISQIERGATKINLDILFSISECLKCEVTDFLYKSDSISWSFYENDILQDYERLSDSEKHMVATLLKTYLEHRIDSGK